MVSQPRNDFIKTNQSRTLFSCIDKGYHSSGSDQEKYHKWSSVCPGDAVIMKQQCNLVPFRILACPVCGCTARFLEGAFWQILLHPAWSDRARSLVDPENLRRLSVEMQDENGFKYFKSHLPHSRWVEKTSVVL